MSVPPIFLSASEPDPERKPEYWISRNLLNVREAVRIFCAHTLAHYPLVYGGHPAITPLVGQIASRIEHQAGLDAGEGAAPAKPDVLMYQSALYVPTSRANDSVVVTPAHEQDGSLAGPESGWRNASLLRMRYEMIGQPGNVPVHLLNGFADKFGAKRFEKFRTYDFSAAVFIGGMEGVEREFHIFRTFHPNTPAYPIVSTGSACTKLLREVKSILPPPTQQALRDETSYNLLMQQILPAPGWSAVLPAGDWSVAPAKTDPRLHVDPPENDKPRMQLSKR